MIFEQVDEKYSYFYLRIKISKPKTEVEEISKPKKEEVPLKLARGFRKDMTDNNILMIYKGDFSQNAILPVLKMIEDNLKSQNEDSGIHKKIYWVLVECYRIFQSMPLKKK